MQRSIVTKLLCTAVLSLFLCVTPIKAETYIGYDLGQMAFNNFKNFAGEISYQFENKSALRMVVMDVLLTERHLSSSEASAVDGNNVEGHWRSIQIAYEVPIKSGFSLGVSAGKSDNFYRHTILNESVRHKTETVGLVLSFKEDDLFGIDNLYWKFSAYVRHSLDPIPETMLGDTVVNDDATGFTPALYLGYLF